MRHELSTLRRLLAGVGGVQVSPSFGDGAAIARREHAEHAEHAEHDEWRPSVNEDQFHALYHRTAPSVRGYLRRVGGDAALADDLLQETYVRFLQSGRSDLQEEDAQKRYLFRIAINLLHDHRRKATRERVPNRSVSAAVPAPDRELRADVEAALAALKPRERAMVWLAYVEGYDHAEIAEVVGVTRMSVRPLLFRARRKLARALEDIGLELGYIEGRLK